MSEQEDRPTQRQPSQSFVTASSLVVYGFAILFAAILTAGCVTTRFDGTPKCGGLYESSLGSPLYHGEGLYIASHAAIDTNSIVAVDAVVYICNAYTTPIFVNVEKWLVFPDSPVKVVCYGGDNQIITKGSMGRPGGVRSRGHPEDYVRIDAGGKGVVGWSCGNMISIAYQRPLDWEEFDLDRDGIYYINGAKILSLTHKMIMNVPFHIEYFLAGDPRKWCCDTNLTLTIIQDKKEGDKTHP